MRGGMVEVYRTVTEPGRPLDVAFIYAAQSTLPKDLLHASADRLAARAALSASEETQKEDLSTGGTLLRSAMPIFNAENTVVGVVVISQAAVVTLLASSLERGAPAIYPLPEGSISDPLSQAMALTAIVIGMAVTALLLVLILRVSIAFGSEELEEVAEDEAARDERLEDVEGPAHRDEEAAAR